MKHVARKTALVALLFMAGCTAKASREDCETAVRAFDLLAAEDCERAVRAFDLMGVPDVRGKEFVRFNDSVGWIVSESAGCITLIEPLGSRTTVLLQRGTDRAPSPGKFVHADFDAFCDYAMKENLAAAAPGDPPHWCSPFERTLLARWAWQRGDEARARELIAAAGGADKSIDSIAFEMRTATIQRSREEPFADVARRWAVLTQLPPNRFTREADEQRRLYRALAAQEKTWVKLDEDAIARLSSEAQAAYWCERLPTVQASSFTDPGYCDVLDCRGPRVSPAERLVAIGWAALPTVVAHFDDERPTRSFTWWRSFAPFSYRILRSSDCAWQVFLAIAAKTRPHYSNGNLELLESGRKHVNIDRALVETLLPVLHDETPFEGNARRCDFAARAIIEALGPAWAAPATEEGNKRIASLERWWNENRDAIDWDKIRQFHEAGPRRRGH